MTLADAYDSSYVVFGAADVEVGVVGRLGNSLVTADSLATS